MRDLKYQCPQHSTMTFDAFVMTVGPFLFLEILKRVSYSLTPTSILLSDCSRYTSFANNQTVKSRLVSVGIKAKDRDWRSADQERLHSRLCSEQLFICIMPLSPHFINSKINTWSIYFFCLFWENEMS